MKQNDSRINAYKRAAGFQPQKMTSDEAARTNAEIEFLLKDKTEQAIQALAGGSTSSAEAQTQSFTPFSFDKAPVYTSEKHNDEERGQPGTARQSFTQSGDPKDQNDNQNRERESRLLNGALSAEDKEKIESQFDFARFAAQTGSPAFAPKKFSARPLDTLGAANGAASDANTAPDASAKYTRPSPVEAFALGLDDGSQFAHSRTGDASIERAAVPNEMFQKYATQGAPWNTQEQSHTVNEPSKKAVPWNGGESAQSADASQKSAVPWNGGESTPSADASQKSAVPWNGGKAELPWKEPTQGENASSKKAVPWNGGESAQSADASQKSAVPWNGGKAELPWKEPTQGENASSKKAVPWNGGESAPSAEASQKSAVPWNGGESVPSAEASQKSAVPWNGGKTELPWKNPAENTQNTAQTEKAPKKGLLDTLFSPREKQNAPVSENAQANQSAAQQNSPFAHSPEAQAFTQEAPAAHHADSVFSVFDDEDEIQVFTDDSAAEDDALPFKPQFTHELTSAAAKKSPIPNREERRYGKSRAQKDLSQDASRNAMQDSAFASEQGAFRQESYFTKMNDKPLPRKNERPALVDTPPSVAEKMGKKTNMNVDVIDEVRRNQEKSRVAAKRRDQNKNESSVKRGKTNAPGSLQSAPTQSMTQRQSANPMQTVPVSGASGMQNGASTQYPDDALLKIHSKDSTKRRIAKFLLLIGTDAAAKVVAKLPQDQINAIIPEIASVRNVSEEEAAAILSEFEVLYKQVAESGGIGTARTILEKSVGPERAEEILQRTVPFPDGKPFDYLKDLQPEQLSLLIKDEDAPVCALVLSQVKPAVAAAVINGMEETARTATIQRLAKLSSLPPDILSRIDQTMRDKVQKIQVPYHDAIDGRGALADILRKMDSDAEKNILAGLHYYDADLENDLRDRLFTMDDIINADDRFIQNKLRDMDDGDIAVLICGKTPEFRKKILSNVSKGRASTILGDEDARKPFSRRESDAVTNEFFNALRRAWENGSLVINERDSDEWVQ